MLANHYAILDAEELAALLEPNTPMLRLPLLTFWSYGIKHELLPAVNQAHLQSEEQLQQSIERIPSSQALVIAASALKDVPALLQRLLTRPDLSCFWLGELPTHSHHPTRLHWCLDEQMLLEQLKLWLEHQYQRIGDWLRKQRPITVLGAPSWLANANFPYGAFDVHTEINKYSRIIFCDLAQQGEQLLQAMLASTQPHYLVAYGDVPLNVLSSLREIASNQHWHVLSARKGELNYPQFVQAIEQVYHQSQTPAVTLAKIQVQAVYSLLDHSTLARCEPPTSQQAVSGSCYFSLDTQQLITLLPACDNQATLCLSLLQLRQLNNEQLAALIRFRLRGGRIAAVALTTENLSSDLLYERPINELILAEELLNLLLSEGSATLMQMLSHARQQQLTLTAWIPPQGYALESLLVYGFSRYLQ